MGNPTDDFILDDLGARAMACGESRVLGTPSEGPPTRSCRPRTALHAWAITLLISFTALTSGCAARDKPPNVVLIVVDTLRPDFLHCYNPEAKPTAAIDSLASEGVQFTTCIAQAPWTLPSIATIMSGQFPATHGANQLRRQVSTEVTLLAEWMRERNYSTGAIVSGTLVESKYGFDRGFSFFDESSSQGHEYVSSEAVTDTAIGWLQDAKEPFFLFVHYFDPHYSYVEHSGFTMAKPYDGAIQPAMDIWDLLDMRPTLTASDIDYIRDLYSGEVLFTDHHLERLLRFLGSRFPKENTVVVLTGDHGEEFMEHGWLGHTRALFQESLWVPLVFSYPRHLEPAKVTSPVSHIDILPTLLGLLGNPVEGLPGRDLFAEPATDGPLFSESVYWPIVPPDAPEKRQRELMKRANVRSVQLGEWKAIEDRLSGVWMLFNLKDDPLERVDRSLEQPGVLSALEERLSQWERTTAVDSSGTAVLSDEDVERLKALGYIR